MNPDQCITPLSNGVYKRQASYPSTEHLDECSHNWFGTVWLFSEHTLAQYKLNGA